MDKLNKFSRDYKKKYSEIVVIKQIPDSKYCIQDDDILLYKYFLNDFYISKNVIPDISADSTIEFILITLDKLKKFINILDSNKVSYLVLGKEDEILKFKKFEGYLQKYNRILKDARKRDLIESAKITTKRKEVAQENSDEKLSKPQIGEQSPYFSKRNFYENYFHRMAGRAFNPSSNLKSPRSIRNGRRK